MATGLVSMDEAVNVTKSFLPPIDEYKAYIDKIWSSGQLTNGGSFIREFEEAASKYLAADDFHLVTNGTIALQIALRALDITEGEIITTPFSYVATTSAILWERCQPVFVDIDPNTLCIDPEKIEAAINENTKAIMPVHVFGNPCDIEAIDAIAKKHNLKVIYDAAHAFGVEYKGKSLLNFGDISICSFHATKLFHTIEGGCLIARNKAVSDKIELIKRFGHEKDDHFMLGINAKASEFQAAMGLCNLKYVANIITERKRLSELYDKLLDGSLGASAVDKSVKYNYAYYPVILDDEEQLHNTMKELESINIFPRRYFYPSLNTLPYIRDPQACPVSEDIASRIICLPLYVGLEEETITKICEVLKK
jgi:dTDP-4-amino-4,6-dideoxygalactose transaminase